jgi:hypothetical protein
MLQSVALDNWDRTEEKAPMQRRLVTALAFILIVAALAFPSTASAYKGYEADISGKIKGAFANFQSDNGCLHVDTFVAFYRGHFTAWGGTYGFGTEMFVSMIGWDTCYSQFLFEAYGFKELTSADYLLGDNQNVARVNTRIRLCSVLMGDCSDATISAYWRGTAQLFSFTKNIRNYGEPCTFLATISGNGRDVSATGQAKIHGYSWDLGFAETAVIGKITGAAFIGDYN